MFGHVISRTTVKLGNESILVIERSNLIDEGCAVCIYDTAESNNFASSDFRPIEYL